MRRPRYYTASDLPVVLLLLLGLAVSPIRAQYTPTVAASWIAPAGPDGTETWYVGRSYDIKWLNNVTLWFPGYADKVDLNNASLWAVAAQPPLGYLISPSINLTNSQNNSLNWTISIANNDIDAVPNRRWKLSFVSANITTGADAAAAHDANQEVSSPQLNIRRNITTVTATIASAPTGPPGGLPAPSTSPSDPSTTSIVAVIDSSSSTTLSPGATAGIAIGAALATALLFLGIWLLLRRRRRARHAAAQQHNRASSFGGSTVAGDTHTHDPHNGGGGEHYAPHGMHFASHRHDSRTRPGMVHAPSSTGQVSSWLGSVGSTSPALHGYAYPSPPMDASPPEELEGSPPPHEGCRRTGREVELGDGKEGRVHLDGGELDAGHHGLAGGEYFPPQRGEGDHVKGYYAPVKTTAEEEKEANVLVHEM